MAKFIIFSRVFPAYHPKAGQSTFFIEKIWKSLLPDNSPISPYWMKGEWLKNQEGKSIPWDYEPKYHTIRKGHRFKVGEKFSPRVWAGKPYRSKHIIIAPDLEIKKTWDIEISIGMEGIKINGDWIFVDYQLLLKQLASNDGLSVADFEAWFNTPSFEGQIICWNEKIDY